MKLKSIAALISLTSFSAIASDNANAMYSPMTEAHEQVTLSNWMHSDYNHWAFQNMGIHPTLIVPRDGNISVIPSALDGSIADLKFSSGNQTYTVDEAMINDRTDGYIVIKDGHIVHEDYFGTFGPKDHHMWASSSKSLMGQAIGILVEQGKIDPNKNVDEYLEELKGSHFGNQTVRTVLNMTSALDYSEDYANITPGTMHFEYFRRLGLVPAYDLMAIDPTQDDTPRGVLEFAPHFTQNPELAVNYKYEYHSPNVDVIGWLIARVSGQPLQDFIAENIWSKLGVEHDATFMADMTFTPIATGGISTTLRDFARVGMAIANDGFYNDHQIFSKAWIEDTFNLTDDEKAHMDRSVYKEKGSGVYDEWLEGYKNYLWVHDSKKGIATFRGVYGQHLYINQDQNLVIATFSSAESASNAARQTNQPRLAAFEAIANHYAK
ncbi:serine hydrolase [Vibrio tubiashii]|uniref:6-aminohexanoate hydrolase n=1 Tax=Vibrio tubiashii ATCC 19109 TaxID=1051646 RepID=F9T9N2_9VIBR|nr:serine hydrolase [Vibrio tubiashii]AIW15625.1 6-aminohexanoate hydrolase [Vibrio tubiashii ATCC 19109]EGU51205.1 6-aminohexanoate-dimer hydrolase [Vibrio tubiashii ATCC 19109]EIF02598.1 6-aminohexanoate-dimer hydrolase [Vibrio tubiashii NCIMB 1337 = ATCC 19106]